MCLTSRVSRENDVLSVNGYLEFGTTKLRVAALPPEEQGMFRTMTVAATLFIAALAFAAGHESPTSAAESNSDAHFDRIVDRFIDQFPALSPVGATALGDHRFDGQLDEITTEARREKTLFCRDLLQQLDALDRGALSRANQVDLAILRNHLRATIWELETLQEWAFSPLLYTNLAGSAVYGLMARDFAPLETRLTHASQRLEQFPRFLEQVRKTLQPDRVPSIHVETAIAQNRGILSILDELVRPNLDELPAEQRSRLERALETARAAAEEHQQWLENELLPNAKGSWRLGAQRYDEKLAYTLDTPLTRQEIRRRAEQQIRKLRDEMYQISQGLYRQRYPLTEFPDQPSEAYRQAIIRSCLEIAYRETPDPEKIVDEAKHSLQLTTNFVREKDLLTLPEDPVEIIVMPEFQRGVSLAYCDSPGPLDAGQKTFYAVAPPPSDWSPEQVQSLLREYNLRSLHNLTIHEAMPGHFVQVALANRCPQRLRAILGSGVFVEGWAVYAEQMMVQAGFLDNDPLMKLIVMKWYLRDATNALLDQAVHVDGMGEREAMKLLVETAFQEEREAAGKWTRARLTSAQLSTYFAGYLELIDLRREAERILAGDFDLKAYHDRVLAFGSPPPRYVRALLLEQEIPQ